MRTFACGIGPTCRDANCHATYLVGSTTLAWSLHVEEPAPAPLPARYVPRRDYGLRLDVTDTDPAAVAWGFEISPLVNCPFERSAGTMVPADPNRARLVADVTGTEYLTHSCLCPSQDPTCCGFAPEGTPGANGWTFTWTAPPRGTGQVVFTFAINAVNWDGTPQFDRVSLGEVAVDEEPCPPALADLRVTKETCDPGQPGVVRLRLASSSPMAFGPDVVRSTSDPALLPASRDGWTLESASCLAMPGASLVFYSVAPSCEEGGEGFH